MLTLDKEILRNRHTRTVLILYYIDATGMHIIINILYYRGNSYSILYIQSLADILLRESLYYEDAVYKCI